MSTVIKGYIVDIDDCLPSPCLHGTCQDHPNGYTCTCNHGYTGTDCRTSKSFPVGQIWCYRYKKYEIK
jgi:hypothetical protein